MIEKFTPIDAQKEAEADYNRYNKTIRQAEDLEAHAEKSRQRFSEHSAKALGAAELHASPK